jgi:hypothetical protein
MVNMTHNVKNVNTYLVYHSSVSTGVLIIGLYCNYKSAIRVAMRKVYQLMGIHTKKVEGEWAWIDGESCITIMTLPIIDAKDIKGDSPLPQFFRYHQYLKDFSVEDLEKFRMQSLNRKKLMDRIKKIDKI